MINIEFCEKVRHLLLAAGTDGAAFRDINMRTRTTNHPTGDLRDLLNAWRKRRWVDCFEVPMPSGQTSERWRATQLLFEQWPMVKQAVLVLLLSPDLRQVLNESQNGNDPEATLNSEPVAAE